MSCRRAWSSSPRRLGLIMAELHPERWALVRAHWERDTDEPSCAVSAARAGDDGGFPPPTKQAVSKRMRVDAGAGDPWVRRGRLAVINEDAQRRADLMRAPLPEQEKKTAPPTPPVPSDPEDAATKRAAVLYRHRQEWMAVVALRNVALNFYKESAAKAMDVLKVARAAADVTTIQQIGERKAWGLDMAENSDQTDDQRRVLYLPDNRR